ncbi:hypothetical protein [Xanthomonas theicola]|uniref:hypothetical protein n=1 Tax=Xanthomonas theicola TaxID=56464 RepID=UPI000FF88EF0|nr:hypothetical protein [Xanthomonas theicola]QNH24819.1 hypothetical protein G4Q83_08760 [Xanthomonas theicola]
MDERAKQAVGMLVGEVMASTARAIADLAEAVAAANGPAGAAIIEDFIRRLPTEEQQPNQKLFDAIRQYLAKTPSPTPPVLPH